MSNSSINMFFQVMKACVFYWKDKSPSGLYSAQKNFPSIACTDYYSLPSYEYPGLVKVRSQVPKSLRYVLDQSV